MCVLCDKGMKDGIGDAIATNDVMCVYLPRPKHRIDYSLGNCNRVSWEMRPSFMHGVSRFVGQQIHYKYFEVSNWKLHECVCERYDSVYIVYMRVHAGPDAHTHTRTYTLNAQFQAKFNARQAKGMLSPCFSLFPISLFPNSLLHPSSLPMLGRRRWRRRSTSRHNKNMSA